MRFFLDETGGNGSLPKSRPYSTFGMTNSQEVTGSPATERRRTISENGIITGNSSLIEHRPEENSRTEETTTPRRNHVTKWSILISLAYANFWIAASVSLQAPFFPREAESKGATPTQYGLVFGVFELVVIIMSPIYGRLIPKISPKFLIAAGCLLGGASCCLFGVLDYIPAGKTYISMAFLVRIVEGFGAAAVLTASFTIIASSFPETVATSFSLMETAFGFGLIVGPTIGGALYQAGGFLLPFVVNGSCLLLGCIILYFLLPRVEDTERQEGSRNLWSFLADGSIIAFSLSIISSFLFIGFNAATLEPHLRQFQLKPIILGSIFVISGGVYAITTPLWGRICDKGANPFIVNIIGYMLSLTGILLIGPAPFMPFKPTLGTVIGALVVTGFGLAAKLVSSFIGALKNVAQRGFPDNLSTYGMVSALVSTSCSLGAFIGPSLGGFLLENTGYKMGTIVIFSLELISVLIISFCWMLVSVRNRREKARLEEVEPLLRPAHVRTYSYTAM